MLCQVVAKILALFFFNKNKIFHKKGIFKNHFFFYIFLIWSKKLFFHLFAKSKKNMASSTNNYNIFQLSYSLKNIKMKVLAILKKNY